MIEKKMNKANKLMAVSILAASLLSACGSEGPMGPVGPTGPSGRDAPTTVSFEGYYLLPSGGYADVLEDSRAFVTMRVMRVIVTNNDGSTGIVPVGSTGVIPQLSGVVYNRVNVTLVDLHNLKHQTTGVVLTGSHLIETRVTKVNSKLVIRSIVSNTSGVVFDQTVESL